VIAPLLLAAVVAAAGPPPLTCTGNYVPPVDYDERGRPVTVEFHVSSAPRGTARDVVMGQAQRALVQRLCRLADAGVCDALQRSVKPWSTGEGSGNVCAMAIVRSPDLEAWRTMMAPDLDAELRSSLTQLFPDEKLEPTLLDQGRRRRSALVVLDRIDDGGVPGGLRADWLLGRVRAALTALRIDVVATPARWDGRLPRGVEFAVRGSLIDRVDPRRQVPVVDVVFTAIDKKGLVRASPSFSIPAALAPPSPTQVTTPPPTAGLSLHVETRPGGSLCPGDFTQIYVTNETSEPMVVRVLNLDANGEALVLFPNEQKADDVIAPGATVALSPDGFNVDGAAHGRERYIAIGARTREALGRFRDARGTCRYRREDAARLQAGQALEATWRGVGGFTLLDDVRCNKAIPLPDPQVVAGALADVPWCPALER
jgi:hypothetical protein